MNKILILLTFFILVVGFDKQASSKEPQVFQDFGMLVSQESRTYPLEIETGTKVSYKATGETNKGNIDCAIVNSKHEIIMKDNSSKNECSLEFINPTHDKFYFVLRNNSEEIQRFSASIVY